MKSEFTLAEFARGFPGQERYAVLDRESQPGSAADQFVALRMEDEARLGQRADKYFQELAVDAFRQAFGLTGLSGFAVCRAMSALAVRIA